MTAHFPKRRFGQNFLHDEGVIFQILSVIAPSPGDNLLEIGPGQGALTLPLLNHIGQMSAVELDRDLIPLLKQKSEKLGSLTLFQKDILQFDLTELNPKEHSLRIVGNLPYNISTPVLFHLLKQLHFIRDMHFMLQKEVAERLAASVGNKQYGRLSIMAQYYCDIALLFPVFATSFDPIPKVESAFIRLTPKKQHNVEVKDIALLEKVVKLAFSQRRKTLANTLSTLLTRQQLIDLGMDPVKRPEQVSVDDFVKMANWLYHHRA